MSILRREIFVRQERIMAVYRHFDLKKYVKIKNRASDIILATLGFVIVSVPYYLRLVANERFA